jgi:hypothetical protein
MSYSIESAGFEEVCGSYICVCCLGSTVHLTSSVNILLADNTTYVIVLWESRVFVFWFQNFNVCVAVFDDTDGLSEKVKIITQVCSRVRHVK